MQTSERPAQSSSASEAASSQNATQHLEKGENTEKRKVVAPAKLPEHSAAAFAQKLNDLPERPVRGVYYSVPHLRTYPTGWRTRRHIKRKNLRHSYLSYNRTERTGTQWAMLPMAFCSLILVLVASTVLVTLSGIAQATQQRYGQQTVTLQDILPGDSLKMYDSHGTLLYQMVSDGLQTSVPLSQISIHMQQAQIAIEDKNFWSDPGYDITGIVRAALDDLTSGHIVGGGSTITQQLIKKNIVGDRDTVIRKLEEVILAPQVTRYYTKQQILDMYLNTTYYGEQAYGVDAAAFTYFGLKDTPQHTAASQLDIAQSAMLAGMVQSPYAYDPLLHPEASATRTQEVLTQMYLQGYITNQERFQAIDEIQQPNFLHHSLIHNTLAPHFVNYAIGELAQDLHVKVSDLARSGLVVSTTLDLALDNKVLKDAQTHIAALAQVHHMSDAAVVAIDYHNGDIRALIGNINPNNPQYGAFDVATQGYRQPGSSFKPFVYATAFEQGVSPGMPVLDAPYTIEMCCGLPPYTPHNYDLRYHGLITYRYALQNSFNVPAVKLLVQTGVDQSLHTAEQMGISSYVGTPNYTMVLGSLGVHLLDETSAYGVFANGGVRVPAHAIDTVRDTQGRIIWHFQPQGQRVISKQVAYMMTNVLSDNNARTYEFGKCSMLYLFSNTQTQCYEGNPGTVWPSAVKTGTSNNFDDNWTVGYTTDYVVGVWAGNNDNSPMINVTGVDGAGPIWHDTMLMLEQGHPPRDFTNPGGVVMRTVSYPGITSTDLYLKK